MTVTAFYAHVPVAHPWSRLSLIRSAIKSWVHVHERFSFSKWRTYVAGRIANRALCSLGSTAFDSRRRRQAIRVWVAFSRRRRMGKASRMMHAISLRSRYWQLWVAGYTDARTREILLKRATLHYHRTCLSWFQSCCRQLGVIRSASSQVLAMHLRLQSRVALIGWWRRLTSLKTACRQVQAGRFLKPTLSIWIARWRQRSERTKSLHASIQSRRRDRLCHTFLAWRQVTSQSAELRTIIRGFRSYYDGRTAALCFINWRDYSRRHQAFLSSIYRIYYKSTAGCALVNWINAVRISKRLRCLENNYRCIDIQQLRKLVITDHRRCRFFQKKCRARMRRSILNHWVRVTRTKSTVHHLERRAVLIRYFRRLKTSVVNRQRDQWLRDAIGHSRRISLRRAVFRAWFASTSRITSTRHTQMSTALLTWKDVVRRERQLKLLAMAARAQCVPHQLRRIRRLMFRRWVTAFRCSKIGSEVSAHHVIHSKHILTRWALNVWKNMLVAHRDQRAAIRNRRRSDLASSWDRWRSALARSRACRRVLACGSAMCLRNALAVWAHTLLSHRADQAAVSFYWRRWRTRRCRAVLIRSRRRFILHHWGQAVLDSKKEKVIAMKRRPRLLRTALSAWRSLGAALAFEEYAGDHFLRR